MAIPEWRVLRSEIIVDSPYYRLRRDAITLPDGTRIDDYYIRESRGFSAIFALTDDGQVVLVRQFKYVLGRMALELPAGIIDEGEDAATCAARELAEETGYVAKSMEFVRKFPTEPTNSTLEMYLFLARGARKCLEQNLDPAESIEVRLHNPAELRAFIARGEIDVAPQVAAIYYILENFGIG